MTQTEYLADSDKLCEKMGKWPEWEQGNARCYLRLGRCGWAVDIVAPPYGDDEYFDASES